MTRRNIRLIALVLLLVIAAYFAWDIYREEERKEVPICKMDEAELVKEFAVKDTANVNKVVITDTDGNRAIISRNGTLWNYQGEYYNEESEKWKKGKVYRARQDAIELLLKTFHRIELRNFVPENAQENIVDQTAAAHHQVDIYVNNKLHRTWIVGIPSADHYGTYMLLEIPGCGRSKYPYEMGMKAFNGTLWVRFFTDEKDWRYTGIWELAPEELARVEITPHTQPDQAFAIEREGVRNYTLYDSEGNVIQKADYSDLYEEFRKIHYDKIAELEQVEKDSIINTAPLYYTIETTTKDGETKRLRITKIKVPEGTRDMAGEYIEYDVDHLYAITDENEVLKIQYYVFGGLFRTLDDFRPATPHDQ